MSDSEGTFESLSAVMGPVTTNLSVTPQFFGNILSRLHRKFGISFKGIDAAYGVLFRAARGLGGTYRAQAAGMSRELFIRKLTGLLENTRRANESLKPFRGSMRVWMDRESLSPANPVTYGERFLEFVSMTGQFLDTPYREVDEVLEAAAESLETIIAYCEAILPGMEGLPAKRGQRGLGWYDDFVEIMLEVAAYLGINPSTDARSSRVADVTPFTMLVFECEKIFPPKGHSSTPTACARRIERSLKSLREGQQNSSHDD